MNENLETQSRDFDSVEQAIYYIEQNFQRQPSLDDMAEAARLSKYHFQRLFKRWAGVTPTQFMHFLTVSYAKERLEEAPTVFDAALDAGLSSAGRLHDLFVAFEAMSPGEYKRSGAGLDIVYGFHPTTFGQALLAQTQRGICALRFVDAQGEDAALTLLRSDLPQATFTADQEGTRETIQQLFYPQNWDRRRPFHLHVRGTNFQVKVWQALLSVPAGTMVSYSDLASALGTPEATRAVAGAVAKNPIGYLIPCHRVISKNGRIHNYRWGAARKKAILGWEASRLQVPFAS